MIIGTCHFLTFDHAVKYYTPYGFDSSDVMRKIKEHEIAIGLPPYDPETQRLQIVDGGTRWGIESITPEQRAEMRQQALGSLWEARERALDGDLP